VSMASITRFLYQDVSLAIREAFHQRALGQRVAVGRDVGETRWHVRILGPAEVRA
jgi:hypothetical protein